MGKHTAMGRVFDVEEKNIPQYCKTPGCRTELTKDEIKDNKGLCNACQIMKDQGQQNIQETVDEINSYEGGGR